MQLNALLPVLALLAAVPSLAHSNLDRRVQNANHAKLAAREETAALHARAAERIAEQVEKRQPPVALATKPRKVKRDGAKGCRPRGAAYTPPASASPAPPASTTDSAPAQSSAADNSDNASPSPSADNLAADAQVSVSVGNGGVGVGVSVGTGNSGGGSSQGVDGMTPNGIKAGLSGTDTIGIFKDHVGWFWDYGPTTNGADPQGLVFMPTLWGNGQSGESQDWGRLQAFQAINDNPKFVQGFYEPDCSPPMSSSIDPSTAAWQWNQWVAPWKNKGAYLVSPGMCKQKDENWLGPFLAAGATPWDITSIHINKLDLQGAKDDIDYYWNTYNKPIFVTEFACVDDQNGFTPSSDQGQINQYINDLVDLFEGDDRIKAYSMSEGMGLGNVWPPFMNGQLTESGQTYLNAISKYH